MAELTRRTLAAVGRPTSTGEVLADLLHPGEPRRTLVVVDQLEEAWTLCADAGERTSFLDVLADLATHEQDRTSVLLVLRADFVSALADHPGLAGSLTDGTLLVGVPTAAEVRRSVTVPAARAGVRFEPGLDETIVTDAGSEPGVLPLLSVALTRLWEQREGDLLTYASYVALGGVAGAIADQAERAYAALEPDRQATARALLLRLAGTTPAGEVVRSRVRRDDVAGLGGDVDGVVAALAGARLLTLGDDTVEVAHESLFTHWPRLAGWLAEDGAGRDVQRRLAAAASEWASEDRDPSLLWRGPRLDAALDVRAARPAELTDTEHGFLDASRAALDAEVRDAGERATRATAQNRRLRVLVGAVVLTLVLALVAGALAWRSRGQERAAAVAADAKRLAAQAVNEEHLDLALLGAVEAVRTERAPETYGALLTLLARVPDLVRQVRSSDRFLRGAATPDGRTVFLSEYEPVLWALDGRTGRTRWKADTGGNVLTLDHGPAGLLGSVATDRGGRLVLWDPATGEELWRIQADDVTQRVGEGDPTPGEATWTADGRIAFLTATHLVTADETGRVLDARPTRAPVPPSWLRAWPDGRVSWEAPWDAGHVLDPSTGRVRDLPFSIDAVSPDGRLVVTADRSEAELVRIRLRDADTFRPVGQEIVVSSYDGGLAWSPDGRRFAIGAGETLRVHDLTGRLVRAYPGAHTGAIMTVLHSGEDRVWTGGRDGVASQWDLAARDGFVSRARLPESPHTGDASADGSRAVFTRFHQDRLNEGWMVSPDTGSDLVGPLPTGCLCQVTDVAMAADGSVAVGALEEWRPGLRGPYDDRGALAVWSPDGELLGSVDLPWLPVGVGVTSDGERALVQGSGGHAVVDLARRRTTVLVEREDPSNPPATDSVRVAPDGEQAVVLRGGGVLLVDAGTGEVVRERSLGSRDTDAPTTAAWSADGRTLSVGTLGGRLHFLAADDLRPVAPSRLAAAGFLIDQAVSPDGRVLATLGSDGDLRLWDTGTWAPLGLPLSEAETWGFLSFAEDGDRLRVLTEGGSSASPDGGVLRSLDVDPQAWVDRACAIANRQLTEEELAVVRPGREWRATCP